MKPAMGTAVLLLVIARAAGVARADCQIDGVSPVAFGAYDPLSSAPLDTTGSVTYRCSLAALATIEISAGSSGNVAARTMARTGGGTLEYNLFSDPARLIIWGDTPLTRVGPVVGTGGAVTAPIYGRIPAHQEVSAGTYSDTITVTINF